jgi:ornithine carbamoyltransferase
MYNYTAMLTLTPAQRLRGRSIVSMLDMSPAEIADLLLVGERLKDGRLRDQVPLLRGRTLGLLFEKPSLRTRVSFEVAMTQLGGNAIMQYQSEVMMGSRETPEDVARTLSRYVDAIAVRTHAHEPLQRFARAATVPVVNALSQSAHPCQALADLLTIKERFGTLEGLRLCYIGDGKNNVAASLTQAAAMCGASITFGSPLSHRPTDAFMGELLELGKAHGITVRTFASAVRAVREVDVVYTDAWTSMGDEAMTERNAAALRPYQVDAKLMEAAAPHALFMHCLPAHRGEEVTPEVIDGPRSVIFDQAENRLHMQKALLLALLTDLKGFVD